MPMTSKGRLSIHARESTQRFRLGHENEVSRQKTESCGCERKSDGRDEPLKDKMERCRAENRMMMYGILKGQVVCVTNKCAPVVRGNTWSVFPYGEVSCCWQVASGQTLLSLWRRHCSVWTAVNFAHVDVRHDCVRLQVGGACSACSCDSRTATGVKGDEMGECFKSDSCSRAAPERLDKKLHFVCIL